MLAGQVTPPVFDLARVENQLASAEYRPVAQSLRDVNLDSAVDLFASYTGDKNLAPWLEHAAINRDRDLRLQYLAGLALNHAEEDTIYREMLVYWRRPVAMFRGRPEQLEALFSAMEAGHGTRFRPPVFRACTGESRRIRLTGGLPRPKHRRIEAAGAGLAQLVEHVICNHGVAGSIPAAGTKNIAHVVIELLSNFFLDAAVKLTTGVTPRLAARVRRVGDRMHRPEDDHQGVEANSLDTNSCWSKTMFGHWIGCPAMQPEPPRYFLNESKGGPTSPGCRMVPIARCVARLRTAPPHEP